MGVKPETRPREVLNVKQYNVNKGVALCKQCYNKELKKNIKYDVHRQQRCFCKGFKRFYQRIKMKPRMYERCVKVKIKGISKMLSKMATY